MHAKDKALDFLKIEGKMIIPFFQRNYVWNEDNWEAILSEFFDKSESEGSFLGSIILKQIRRYTGEPNKLEVIDGQQRLTTLSILLKALYDTFSDDIKRNSESEVRSLLFFKKDPTAADYEIRIEHSRVDVEAYERVIKAGIDGQILGDAEEKNEHKIIQCYKYFLKELNNYPEDDRRLAFNKIITTKMFVVIDLEEGDDEQTIFDTLNTAGVRLTISEIIKNAIFQRVVVLMGKDDAIRLYRNTWERIFISDENTKQYWETERRTGRIKRDNLEILLHCFAIIKGFFDPDENTLSELSKIYKKEVSKIKEKEKLEKFINELMSYAELYKENFTSIDNKTLLSFDNQINRLLHILDVLEISTFHPFILYVLRNCNENELSYNLANLEKFVIRRAIAKGSTKNYNKYCKEFIKNPQEIISKLRETTNEQISNGLKNISNKLASLLLFWIELKRRNKDNKIEIKELKYNYSLEHIMPQKWEEYWTDIPKKYNPDGSEMTEEEKKKDRDNKIYWLGNMTLLTSSLNSSLRNYEFRKKMEGEGRKRGIKRYAELLITKEDIVDPYENGDKVWDEYKIMSRTSKLEEEIKEIWGI